MKVGDIVMVIGNTEGKHVKKHYIHVGRMVKILEDKVTGYFVEDLEGLRQSVNTHDLMSKEDKVKTLLDKIPK